MIFARKVGFIALVHVVMLSFLKNRVLCGNCFGSTKTSHSEEPKIKRIPCSSSGWSTPTRHRLPQAKPFMPFTFPIVRSFSFPRSQRRKSSSAIASNSLRLQPVTVNLESSSQRERNHPHDRPNHTRPIGGPETLLPISTSRRPATPPARPNINRSDHTRLLDGTEPFYSSINKPRPVIHSARPSINRPVNLRPVQVSHRRRHSSPLPSPKQIPRLPSIREGSMESAE